MLSTCKEPDEEAIHDDQIQYGQGSSNTDGLDANHTPRPRNHSKTLPFHALLDSFFDPLRENRTRPSGPTVARSRKGANGSKNLSPHAQRRNIIERFISRWRAEVGHDFYPALRLILPGKDRYRFTYGLKEKVVGKLIIKMLNISPHSADAKKILDWKLPGTASASQMAGDFAGRCYEALSKRAMLNEVGDMRIAEVNQLLDRLSTASKETEQLIIFQTFYSRMNATELMWLIRIILRKLNIGALEKILLQVWHPDGEALFNVCSSLRRVCWELTDPSILLERDKIGVTIMEPFQPQLAQFQMYSIQKMIEKFGCTEEAQEFWIEEKLDGERMQLHMVEDSKIAGGFRFAFWSRRGTDYTCFYGNGYEDDTSSLTRFIKGAFSSNIRNIVLDGEMITWDPKTNRTVEFGTLKSAAISELQNPFDGTSFRPLFRVFDCLYVNERNITPYVLSERRKVMEKVVKDVDQRIEVHKYTSATEASQVEEELRKVIAESSEGLVLKNPRSAYRLNSRNDDWMKVKPEYMTEFGVSLDCVIIGGYYGQGHRGGIMSSFLCGLRSDENHVENSADPIKCCSFFKVGGGFRAGDYTRIMHLTNGKWHDWDTKHPPTNYIELGGGRRQYERPDRWIKPDDSLVLEVKAASIVGSDQFGTGFTLRFPRFKQLREDKSWKEALSIHEFEKLRTRVEANSKEREFKVDTKRRVTKRLKKEISIAGNDPKSRKLYVGPQTQIFQGLNFCVLSQMVQPYKTKTEIEQMIKANGGKVFQSPTSQEEMICIADKHVVRVASLMATGKISIVKPIWILDALWQSEIDGPGRERFLIPFEPRHMLHVTDEARTEVERQLDAYNDSYARDTKAAELRDLMAAIVIPRKHKISPGHSKAQLWCSKGFDENGDIPGSMFRRCKAIFVVPDDEDVDIKMAKHRFRFGGGEIVNLNGYEDGYYIADDITHLVLTSENGKDVRALRERVAMRWRPPRTVGLKWVTDCWQEKTLLDEEAYVI